MAEYICVVDATSQTQAADGDRVWPKVIPVPPPVPSQPRAGVWTAAREGLDPAFRTETPEAWLVAHVLPKYPGCKVTLYRSDVAFEPSTHKKVGE